MSCFHAIIHSNWLASGKNIEGKEPPVCSNIQNIAPDENGFYLIDDVMLTKEQLKLFRFNPQSVTVQAIAYEQFRWPNGVVPYVFSANVTKDKRKIIRESIQDMNNRLAGCVKIKYEFMMFCSTKVHNFLLLFRPRKSSNNKYVVVNMHGEWCRSNVGMVPKDSQPQTLHLTDNCLNHNIQHEFLHAVGVYHTQARSDRDEHVKIHWDNIDESYYIAYCKQRTSLNFKTKYEPRSFMHYFWNAAAINNSEPTVSLKVISHFKH